MTQYQDPFSQPYSDPTAQPRKNSGLAVTALVFALIFFCPITTILAPILGAIAFATIGSNPARKGKGMAVAAIILGLVFTGAQYVVGKKMWDFGMGFYTFVMKGPEPALQMGFAGDNAGFKGEFFGAGAAASDAEVGAFIEGLRSRYGNFVNARFDEKQGGPPPQPAPGEANISFPYILTFSNKTVSCETELWFADKTTGSMMKKLGFIKVLDPDAGTLTFPLSAASSGGAPSAPTPPAGGPVGGTTETGNGG